MHSNGTHYETRSIGSEEELYHGALSTVLVEMGLIRARRGLEDGAVMPEAFKELPVNDLSSMVKISSNETSWTVAIEPIGRRYVYDYSLSQVTLYQSGAEEGTVIQRDSDGVKKLRDLHEVLFGFHDAGL